MFVAAGLFFILTIAASFFAFRKKPSLQRKVAKIIFWVSLVMLLALTLLCVLYIKYLINEGMREQWLIDSMKHSS